MEIQNITNVTKIKESVLELYLPRVTYLSSVSIIVVLIIQNLITPKKTFPTDPQRVHRFIQNKTITIFYSVLMTVLVIKGPLIFPVFFLCGLKFHILSRFPRNQFSAKKEREKTLSVYEIFYLFVFGVFLYFVDGEKNQISAIDVSVDHKLILIKFRTAFVGFSSQNFVVTPVLVFLGVYSSLVLVCIFLCIASFYKLQEKSAINSFSDGASTETTRLVAKYSNELGYIIETFCLFNSLKILFGVLNAFVLKSHWEIATIITPNLFLTFCYASLLM